jgi:hypothetical protein
MGVAKVSAASVRFWAASSADLNLYNIQDPGPPYSLVGFPAFSISLTHSETLSVAELLFKVDLGLAFFKLTTRPYALVINRVCPSISASSNCCDALVRAQRLFCPLSDLLLMPHAR